MIMKKFKNILYLEIDNSKELNTIMIPGFLQTNKTYQNLFKTISQYSNIYFIELPGFGITEQIDRVVREYGNRGTVRTDFRRKRGHSVR